MLVPLNELRNPNLNCTFKSLLYTSSVVTIKIVRFRYITGFDSLASAGRGSEFSPVVGDESSSTFEEDKPEKNEKEVSFLLLILKLNPRDNKLLLTNMCHW